MIFIVRIRGNNRSALSVTSSTQFPFLLRLHKSGVISLNISFWADLWYGHCLRGITPFLHPSQVTRQIFFTLVAWIHDSFPMLYCATLSRRGLLTISGLCIKGHRSRSFPSDSRVPQCSALCLFRCLFRFTQFGRPVPRSLFPFSFGP